MPEHLKGQGVEVPSPSPIRYFVGTVDGSTISNSPLLQAVKAFTNRPPLHNTQDDSLMDDQAFFGFMERQVRDQDRKLSLAIAQDQGGQTLGVFGALINTHAQSPICFVYWSVDDASRMQGIGTALLTLNAGELFFQGYTQYASTVNSYSRRLVEKNEMGTIFPKLKDPQTGLVFATFSFDEPRLRRAYSAAGFSFDEHRQLRAS